METTLTRLNSSLKISRLRMAVMAGELKASTVATAAPLYCTEKVHIELKTARLRPYSTMKPHWERGRRKRLRLSASSPHSMPNATKQSRQKASTREGSW